MIDIDMDLNYFYMSITENGGYVDEEILEIVQGKQTRAMCSMITTIVILIFAVSCLFW